MISLYKITTFVMATSCSRSGALSLSFHPCSRSWTPYSWRFHQICVSVAFAIVQPTFIADGAATSTVIAKDMLQLRCSSSGCARSNSSVSSRTRIRCNWFFLLLGFVGVQRVFTALTCERAGAATPTAYANTETSYSHELSSALKSLRASPRMKITGFSSIVHYLTGRVFH